MKKLEVIGGIYEQYEVRSKYGVSKLKLPEKYKILITPIDENLSGSDVKIPNDVKSFDGGTGSSTI